MSSINLGPKNITQDLLFCLDGSASTPAIKTPKQIANCVRWFDADDSSTIVTETGGTGVRYWFDKSDIGANLTGGGLTLSKEPNIVANGMNNRTVIRFDGGDYLDGAFTTSYTEFTIFCLFKGNESFNSRNHVLTINNGVNTTNNFNFNINDAYAPLYTLWVYWNSGGTPYAGLPLTSPNTKSDFLQGSPTLLSFTHTNAGSGTNTIYVNGRTRSDQISAGTQTITIGGAGFSLYIGSETTTPTQPFKGDVCEVIIYSRALSQKERRSVEGYLSKKWNVPLALNMTDSPIEDLSSNTEITSIVNASTNYPTLVNYYKEAISLNQTGSYFLANKPSNIDYLGTTYTIEWCGAIYARRNVGTNYAIITTEIYPSSGLVLRVDGSTRIMYHRSNFITASAGSDNAGGEILPGVYYHYMIVFDNGRLRFYRDGVLTTDYGSGQYVPGSNGSSIFYVLGDTQTLEGETLTLKLHRRAFTATEAAYQYNLIKARIDAVPNKMLTTNLALWIDLNYASSYPNSGTSVYDLTSNAYNWTTYNSPTFSPTDPKCMNFDGSDDHWILTADIASPSTGAGISLPSANNWSWTFWFKTSAANGVFLSHAGSGPVYCAFQVTSSYLAYRHYNGGWLVDSSTTTNVADGLWHCATFVNSANTMIIYLDGNVEKTSFASNVSSPINPVNMIGAYVYTDLFNGKMGHVIYHTTNLSASQVRQVYDATKFRYGK